MGELAIKEQATPAIFMQPQAMQALVQFAELMSKAAFTVPKHLQGKPSDCLAIAMQAQHWGMDPFVVAQKTHLVNGTLGYEAQLVNAVIQNSGAVEGAPSYEYRGEGSNLECRVGFILRGHKSITWNEWLRCGDITTKNSPLWKVNPKQQLGYLQIKNWSRLYCPGAILGIYTDDELVDYAPPGAKDMGAADEVRPTTVEALPFYEPALFETNFQSWAGVIQSGRKTPEQIIDMVQSKAQLTDEQKALIRKAAEVDNDTGAVGDQPPAVEHIDPRVVEKRLRGAQTVEALDLAADDIRRVADTSQADALTAVYRSLRAKFTQE